MKKIVLALTLLLPLISFSQRYKIEVVNGDTVVWGNIDPEAKAKHFMDSLTSASIDTILHYNYKSATYGWSQGESYSYILFWKNGNCYFKAFDDLSEFKIQNHYCANRSFEYLIKNLNTIKTEKPFEDSLYREQYTGTEKITYDPVKKEYSRITKRALIASEQNRYQLDIRIGKSIFNKKITQTHFMAGDYLMNYELKFVILMQVIRDDCMYQLKDYNRINPWRLHK
jgi:hypothetical protein